MILLLVRGRPITYSDTGIFLTVAQEILNGGRLYVDVIDNKDPLFYYSQAVALATGGWRGPFLADALWLTIAGASSLVLVRLLTRRMSLAFFALLLYPLLLTGIHFFAGMSETPGLALVPLFAFLMFAPRPVLAGLTAAAILLLKLNLAPVVALIVVAALVSGRGPWRTLLWRSAAAFAGLYVAVLLLLGIRGEFGGYLSSLQANRDYANDVLPVVYGRSGISGHLAVIREQTPTILMILALGGIVLAGLLIGLAPAVRRHTASLSLLAGAAWIGCLGVLSLTAVWGHHLELLALPITLTWVLVAWCVALVLDERAQEGESSRTVSAVAVGLIGACVILNGIFLAPPSSDNFHAWADAPYHPVADALLAARPAADSDVTYAHLGQNDEFSMGAFLPSSFHLVCPHIQQYPWSRQPELDETLNCLATKVPDLLAVTPLFDPSRQWYSPDPEASRPWRAFYERARLWIDGHCTPRVTDSRVTVFACGASKGSAARGPNGAG